MMKQSQRKNRFYGVVFLILIIAVCGSGLIAAEEIAAIPGQELTVYNQNLALVKDRRFMDLPLGTGPVSFTDVAAQLDPTSVRFQSLTFAGVRVLEQNFEYDVVSDTKLLQKYLGQKIRLTTVKGEVYEGYLLGAGTNIILGSQSSGGEVKVVKSAQIETISFPELPSGLLVKPTLVWLLNNPGKAGRHLVELTYLTGGISWKADYVMTINAKDDRIDLMGWVTLNNSSGGDYRDARLKLVAGDINRATTEPPRPMMYKIAESAPRDGFQEESFFEYHLYTLGRPTTVKNNQLKQVELLTATGVPVKKLFVYEGAISGKKVSVMLEFKNGKEQNLGMPLPKGVIRVQKADGEGSLQLIGEDRIDHTPKDELIRITLGNAFDIVGERTKLNVREPGGNIREETYQVVLRNHKKEAATINVLENFNRWNEWSIIKSTHTFQKIDAGKGEFVVTVPADGEVTINYTVRYKW
jgi:hypothetical protein